MKRSNFLLGILILLAVVSTRWYKLNLSPSAPYGLYQLTAPQEPLTCGTWVVLPVPAIVRPWWPTWWIPLLKPVAAIEGMVVCVEDRKLWIEEESVRASAPGSCGDGAATSRRMRGCTTWCGVSGESCAT